MKLHYLLTLFLVLPFSVQAQDDCGDVKGLENKAYEDIQQYLKFMKPNGKLDHCEDVFKKFDEKYGGLSTHMYKQYREYLNKFLTNYTVDKRAVKEFQGLVNELREGKGEVLVKVNAEMKNGESQDVLLKHLLAKYKANKNLQVGQDCDIQLKKGQKIEKLNEALIGKDAKLDTVNVCRVLGHKEAEYPSRQRTVRFQLKDGRAIVWYCLQHFDANKDKLYSTKAGCFAYDLLSNKYVLGDQRQTHVYGGEKPFEIVDGRMVLAKSQGYVPLTYAEFLRKNQENLPIDPKSFFQKVPKECLNHPKLDFYENKARLSLINAEKVAIDIEN